MKAMLIMLSLLLASGYAGAEVYKWVDAKGEIHYEDHPKGTPEGKISTDNGDADKIDYNAINKRKTEEVLKDMEKSRKQREQSRRKKLAEQRKQDEKCLNERNKLRALQARMKKKYSEFSNDRPPSYQRQQAELNERRKYLDNYCN